MKNTVSTFKMQKESKDKITMLTAYDYSTAKLIDEAGVNGILVGDSLGMVMLGYEDTLSVTMEDMIHHIKAVTRGAKNALVVGDMPFMSYQTSVYDAVKNAGRLDARRTLKSLVADLRIIKNKVLTLGMGNVTQNNGMIGKLMILSFKNECIMLCVATYQ